MNDTIRKSVDIVERFRDKIKPHVTVVCYSGGNDSSTLAHLCMSIGLADAILHIDTGIGIPETQDFVRETCAKYGWKLYIQLTPKSYEDEVLANGFPGPPQHNIMYRNLKEKAIRLWKKNNFPRRRVILLTGARIDESRRRMGNTQLYKYDTQFHWVNPIMHWTKRDCLQYLRANDVETNPVSALLGMSGECMCGAFASEKELAMLKDLFPKFAKKLMGLEKRVRAAGFPWGWDDRIPKWWTEAKRGQGFLPGLEPESTPLCTSCQQAHHQALQHD